MFSASFSPSPPRLRHPRFLKTVRGAGYLLASGDE
jgi:hypothetical protein